jgi:hypothetical protein
MLKNRWRLKGIIVFGLFAIMEIGDLTGLLVGFSNPEVYARNIGISSHTEQARLIVLSILATGVVLSTLISILGFFRKRPWIRTVTTITASLFVLYGGYQIFSALTQINQNKAAVIFAGAIFILLGTVCDWLGRRAQNEIIQLAGAPKKK